MGAAKHIKIAMASKDIKPGEVAERLQVPPQSFYNKLSRDTMKDTDVETIADKIGCDVRLVDRITGDLY